MAKVKEPIVPEQPVPVVPEDGLRRLLGVLAAVLVLIAGLAVLAAKRAGRRARAGQAA